ncbi:MAG: CoA transferase [Dehalococcoidia bacterium]|nr:CoA transferase [Dehalococcoidia bacterium]MSQ16667.1 CoA transferase [Dehalococcoidia bacterium]
MPFNLFGGLKVLDLGQGISGPFCAKLFADLGAQVVKVEPPAGDSSRQDGPFPGDAPDPERSGLFLALNTNKLGVTLNLESASGRGLLVQLAQGADMLIESFPPAYLPSLGLDYAAFRAANSRLVVTSITPFGQTGPWANWQASNLILSNLAGHSREHPGPVDDLAKQPPLQLAARQAEFVAGLAGATASVLALNRRRLTGLGSHVDVSGMEALALLPQTTLAEFSLGKPPKGRHKDVAGRQSLLALLPCRDGFVGLSPRQQDQWERCVEMMGSPEWASDPKFATRESRLAHWDELEPRLAAWTGGQNKEDVYRLAQGHRIPSFPLNTAADLFESAQFRAREFFVEVGHPAAGPLRYPGWPIQLGSGQKLELTPAPLLGQDNAAVLGAKGLGLTQDQLVSLRTLNVI